MRRDDRVDRMKSACRFRRSDTRPPRFRGAFSSARLSSPSDAGSGACDAEVQVGGPAVARPALDVVEPGQTRALREEVAGGDGSRAVEQRTDSLDRLDRDVRD